MPEILACWLVWPLGSRLHRLVSCETAILAFLLPAITVPAYATGVDAPTDCLPPWDSAYVGVGFHQSYGAEFAMQNLLFHRFTTCELPPPAEDVTLSFEAEAMFEVSIDGGSTWVAHVVPVVNMKLSLYPCDWPCGGSGCCPPPRHCELCSLGLTCLDPDEGCIAGFDDHVPIRVSQSFFVTWSQQLVISGGTLPPGMQVRVNPVRFGWTTVTELGGGNFHIDSDFFVDTELSLDNGHFWMRADHEGYVQLGPDPTEPVTVRTSTWGAVKALYR